MKNKNSRLNTQLAESINGMSIIQQFRQEDRMVDEFEETNDSYFQSRFSMTKINALLLSPVINLFYTIAVILILGLFGYDALQGSPCALWNGRRCKDIVFINIFDDCR